MLKQAVLFLFIFGGRIAPLFAQEDLFKEFAEPYKSRKFCLYPSTLRMINLANNQDYNKLVSDVEKVLIYRLDSTAQAEKRYSKLIKDFESEGFEEYIRLFGQNNMLMLLGEEKSSSSSFMGVFSSKEGVFCFYLTGKINWEKIPTLINTFQENEFLNLANLGNGNWD
jgi:hypothetical protein